MRFPLPSLPTRPFHKGSGLRWFGAPRAGGARAHAACDLIAKQGTPVLAVGPGIVLYHEPGFYKGTWSLVVHHYSFIVRYAEVAKKLADGVVVGFAVSEGQELTTVGMSTSGSQMLHFEMYKGSATGTYSQKSNSSNYDFVPVKNYERRKDLLDPTPYLDEWALISGMI